jgi:hypothetical protein
MTWRIILQSWLRGDLRSDLLREKRNTETLLVGCCYCSRVPVIGNSNDAARQERKKEEKEQKKMTRKYQRP